MNLLGEKKINIKKIVNILIDNVKMILILTKEKVYLNNWYLLSVTKPRTMASTQSNEAKYLNKIWVITFTFI